VEAGLSDGRALEFSAERDKEENMLDHIGFAVADFNRSKAFYVKALDTIGITLLAGGDGYAGFGAEGKAFFWIGTRDKPKGGAHVAFAAKSRADVDAFYRAALAAGGRDNGGPGLRPDYHANYYGAFVFDPDGNNIEAVCHKPA
jgi:catechol 2,3-dioxygenase-like lactoylglutathione lyase family enzyme